MGPFCNGGDLSHVGDRQFWAGDNFSRVELLRYIASSKQGRVFFSPSDHSLPEDHNRHDHKTSLLILIFPVPSPMAITTGTTVPLILDLVFIVVEVGSIGLHLKADVVARIEHHGGGERHGHLPGSSR